MIWLSGHLRGRPPAPAEASSQILPSWGSPGSGLGSAQTQAGGEVGRAVHLVAQPGLLVLVGHLEPGPALEVQRPEAGDPAGLGPRARVLQGQLESVIDAELGPGGTHGPGPLRRPAPSPSAPADPTPARKPRPVPSSRLLDGPAPWPRPRPYITAPPPPAFSRPELPSAEQTSDRAFSRPDRAGLAAPPSGRLGERQRVPLGSNPWVCTRGLEGLPLANLSGPSWSRLHPSPLLEC